MRPFYSLSRVAALALVGASLAACTTAGGGYFTPTFSADAAALPPAAATAVAGDMVAKLAENVGPGTGTIVLKPDASPFAVALEQSLRGWGYAVSTGQETPPADGIPLAYVIDTFEGSVMTRISTPSVELTRSYSMSEFGATPTSPLSVMRRAES
jgi:hypothetical protein